MAETTCNCCGLGPVQGHAEECDLVQDVRAAEAHLAAASLPARCEAFAPNILPPQRCTLEAGHGGVHESNGTWWL